MILCSSDFGAFVGNPAAIAFSLFFFSIFFSRLSSIFLGMPAAKAINLPGVSSGISVRIFLGNCSGMKYRIASSCRYCRIAIFNPSSASSLVHMTTSFLNLGCDTSSSSSFMLVVFPAKIVSGFDNVSESIARISKGRTLSAVTLDTT